MPKRRSAGLRGLVLALGAVCLGSQTAAANGIVLLQDDRRISNTGSGASATPPSPFQDWNASLSQVSQNSRVGTAQMSGTGFANAYSDIENSEGNSHFDISFRATQTLEVTLDGSFDFQDEAFGDLLATATLQKGPTTVFGGNFFPSGMQPFFFQEVIDSGDYRLLVRISPNGNADTFFDFSFDVVAVPEPGTASLFALGLALLGAARSRG